MLLGEFGRSEAKPTHKCHCKFPMDIQGFPAFGQRKNSTTSHVFFGPKSAQENDQCFFFHRCLSDVFEGWWHFPFVFPFSITCQVFIALFWDFPVVNCQIRVVNVQAFVT